MLASPSTRGPGRPLCGETTQAPLRRLQEKLLQPPWHSNQCRDPGVQPVAAPGKGAGRNRAARGQQRSRPAPKEQSCGLELLPAGLAPWARGAGSCLCGEGRQRARSWAAALGTVPPPIPRLPGHREGTPPIRQAPCAPPPSLGTVHCPPPLHQIPGTVPHPPQGRRCPGSRREVAPGARPAPGKPAATVDPDLCPGTSSGDPWRTAASQGRARRLWLLSAARTGLRSGQGPSVRPGSPSRARACARAPCCPQSWQPAPRSAAAEHASAAASVPGRRGRARAGACACPRPSGAQAPEGEAES